MVKVTYPLWILKPVTAKTLVMEPFRKAKNLVIKGNLANVQELSASFENTHNWIRRNLSHLSPKIMILTAMLAQTYEGTRIFDTRNVQCVMNFWGFPNKVRALVQQHVDVWQLFDS